MESFKIIKSNNVFKLYDYNAVNCSPHLKLAVNNLKKKDPINSQNTVSDKLEKR